MLRLQDCALLLNAQTASWETVCGVQNSRAVIYFAVSTFGAFHEPSNAASLGILLQLRPK
jgi:hypothetical protein